MFPKFIHIRQKNFCTKLDDVEKSLRETVNSCGYNLKEFEGKTVGITVGSRGISNIEIIAKTLVNIVKENGGTPVIFAAMGSHGNGCAEGQREMLASLNITEESMGCEIRTCAEAVYYGEAENGMPVYGNTLALEFDKIILLNRIKQHTDFEDITESGIFKVMAIGIGNPRGAANIHANALKIGYGPAIRAAGGLMLKKLPVAFAVGVTENWKHETDTIEAILPENLLERESAILAALKERSVKLPADEFDTLLIKEAGKNISGTCVDTKVIGRIMIAGQPEPEKPKIKTIAVFDFTDESHGNAMGLGVVDLITRRAFDKYDIEATGLTGMTSTCLLQAKIPCIAPTDFDAVKTAFTSAGFLEYENMKVAIIKNTSQIEYMAVSEKLYEDIKDKENIEKIGEPFELEFNEKNELMTKLLCE